MNLLATITTGMVLVDVDNTLTAKEQEEIEARIQDNAITADELYTLGFKDVHYEGVAWTERD